MSKNENTPFIQFANFELKTPSGRVLKKNLNLNLCQGDLVYLKGENGSGKTTFAQTIFQSLKRKRIQVEYLPQLSSLSSSLPFTLGEVIALSNVNKLVIPEGLIDLSILHRPWNQASGGERKKALLIRALLKRPSILILDEPFNHLDVEAIKEIEGLLWELIEKRYVQAVVLASHQELNKSQGVSELTEFKEIQL